MAIQEAHPDGPWTANTRDSPPSLPLVAGPCGDPAARLPVILRDQERTLATAGGTSLLEALPPDAAARIDAASGVVISLQCSSPPASFLEVAIGKVRKEVVLANTTNQAGPGAAPTRGT